ncbi:iron ABC transporter permease [Uliginosibacterium sediminicola]|uniref:Iron ABC transporter permease n=1 Tax=Uliginosibacterium sediminicola TaxID=2024550 RepID=A0ABU9Z2V4_9RHOO
MSFALALSAHRGPRPLRLLPALCLLAGVLLAAQFGAVSLTLDDWLAVLGRLGGAGDQSLRGAAHVLWQIRLPRAVFAVLVGAALGLAGALCQGLFRNPLADPGLLGVSSGAACAAALSIVVFTSFAGSLPAPLRAWLLPAAAFAGALSVCFGLDRLARWLTPGSITGLLLTGIALNALAIAIVGLCTYLANDEQLRSLSFWTLGSLAGASWLLVGLFAAVLLFARWRLQRLLQAMNTLAMGEAVARQVGIDVSRIRSEVLVLVALLSGLAAAWCGMIAFVGLIAPQLVRVVCGPDQRRVLPLSMLCGGALVLLADTLARTLVIPAELPIGILTALLGGPFFLILLRGARGRLA